MRQRTGHVLPENSFLRNGVGVGVCVDSSANFWPIRLAGWACFFWWCCSSHPGWAIHQGLVPGYSWGEKTIVFYHFVLPACHFFAFLERWTGCRSTMRNTFRLLWRINRLRNSRKTGAVNRLLKTMKFNRPWFVMAEIILHPKRFPVATITGVWPRSP